MCRPTNFVTFYVPGADTTLVPPDVTGAYTNTSDNSQQQQSLAPWQSKPFVLISVALNGIFLTAIISEYEYTK